MDMKVRLKPDKRLAARVKELQEKQQTKGEPKPQVGGYRMDAPDEKLLYDSRVGWCGSHNGNWVPIDFELKEALLARGWEVV